MSSSLGAAGAGDLSEQGGDSGSPNVGAGAVSEASAGNGGAGAALGGSGSVSLGGSGGAALGPPDGGIAGPGDPDAAAPDGGRGCSKVPLFRDRDGDGFGSDDPEDERSGCPIAGWATIGGDCFDTAPRF